MFYYTNNEEIGKVQVYLRNNKIYETAVYVEIKKKKIWELFKW